MDNPYFIIVILLLVLIVADQIRQAIKRYQTRAILGRMMTQGYDKKVEFEVSADPGSVRVYHHSHKILLYLLPHDGKAWCNPGFTRIRLLLEDVAKDVQRDWVNEMAKLEENTAVVMTTLVRFQPK